MHPQFPIDGRAKCPIHRSTGVLACTGCTLHCAHVMVTICSKRPPAGTCKRRGVCRVVLPLSGSLSSVGLWQIVIEFVIARCNALLTGALKSTKLLHAALSALSKLGAHSTHSCLIRSSFTSQGPSSCLQSSSSSRRSCLSTGTIRVVKIAGAFNGCRRWRLDAWTAINNCQDGLE